MRKYINEKSEAVCNAPVSEKNRVWYYIFECNTDNITTTTRKSHRCTFKFWDQIHMALLFQYVSHALSFHVFNAIFCIAYKGTGSRDFLPLIFLHETVPPQPQSIRPIRTVANLFENSWRYSQVRVHHRYQWHRWQICHRFQRHRRQILPPVSLVLLIPVANNWNNYQTAGNLK